MNAEQLLSYYERIADAPQAIAQLRRFILDLAVRGKLVPQDANDEPAAELLNLVTDKIAGQANEELPVDWVQANVGMLLHFQYGKGLPANERLETGPIPVFGSNGIVSYCNTPLTTKPSIIIGRKGSAGALNLCNEPSWTTDVAYFVESPPFFNIRYLFSTLQAMSLDTLGRGVKPGLSRSDAYNLLISVPPLAEQQRIVARVDELMALCDKLEAARAAREASRDRLAAASLARLNQPNANPHIFREHAAFTLEHIAALTTRPDQVKALRQAILNLAVRGRLVPQDANDEPAEELLRRIAVGGNSQKVGEFNHTDQFIDLPRGWLWITFGKLIIYSDAGWSPKTEEHPRYGDEWGVLKVSAVSWDKFRAWENKQVLPGTEARLQAQVKRGDFLISRANTLELIARAVIVEEEPIKLMMSDKIVRLHLSEYCNHRFVWIVNNYADFSRKHYMRHASGVSPSMKNVSRDVIMNLPIPLPPLAEQQRIVAKVDALMALCDALEQRLSERNATRQRLLDAILHAALEPAPVVSLTP